MSEQPSDAEQIRDTPSAAGAGKESGSQNEDLHGQAAEALSGNEEGVQPTPGG